MQELTDIILTLSTMGIDFIVFKRSSSGEIMEVRGYRDVGPTQALIEISHCGVCGSDEHYRYSNQGLGHEGVGVIKEVGLMVSEVSLVKVGDRVGMVSFFRICTQIP